MREQQNFVHQFSIVKAQPEERSGSIKCLIKASSEKEDRVGEIILKSAYADSQMRNNFLKEGYLDYNHITDFIDKEIAETKPSVDRLATLQKSKLEAIIGYPEAVGTKDEFPNELGIKDDGFYILGRLIPGNHFVEEIRKGLQSGWKGYGASVSGTAFAKDFDGNKLKRITLKKCAIQPLQESVNGDTHVTLLKSNLVLLRDIQKSFADGTSPVPSQMTSGENELYSKIHALEMKLNGFMNLLSHHPEFADKFLETIYSDILSQILNGGMSLKSSSLRDYIQFRYGLDGETLEDLTDTLFIKITGEQNQC
ncbi:hypothetical protein [Leptospira jelokensis]|uniref:Uncharacterized protein n=1 Tax=Leptospira jelokensis TaxID=2484931 RepID=A0A4Z0ZVR1_9LEPT|nr:hypothetical protein [Leptospira jelokensis]TGL58625.1 hypothetical protein EHQ62_17165 [Leptospira jelokensis]